MTNAITINETNETITSLTGIGADLRGVIVVRDEAVMRKHPGKPLCHQASHAASYWQASSLAASAAASRGRSERPGERFRRSMPEAQVRQPVVFTAVADLPAAAWATLVVSRALSV